MENTPGTSKKHISSNKITGDSTVVLTRIKSRFRPTAEHEIIHQRAHNRSTISIANFFPIHSQQLISTNTFPSQCRYTKRITMDLPIPTRPRAHPRKSVSGRIYTIKPEWRNRFSSAAESRASVSPSCLPHICAPFIIRAGEGNARCILQEADVSRACIPDDDRVCMAAFNSLKYAKVTVQHSLRIVLSRFPYSARISIVSEDAAARGAGSI